ncbi:WD40 repeat domain-containing protein [Alteromonas sp. a30]|uniref:WD40 repeat domain-containing protein n=1 Tax=Alteromonas sp. a30 TaxID=2730917 RepID=UPI0022831AC8|nr:hypothetical protein [Alteromonas sp. a30]MCY7295647.1 hypothetical protein [Alteromonas sp. a30]
MKHLLSLSLVFLLFACDVYSNKPVNYFQHAESGSLATAFSDDAAIGIVSSNDEGIVVWDLQYNQKIYQWNHQGQDDNANVIGLVNISPDKSHAVTADREAFAIWDLNTGEPIGFWRIDESSVRDIAVSNGGNGILVGRGNGKVLYFEHRTGRRIEFLGHQERINSVALSPNGLYALTGGNDYTAFLWNTKTGQIVYKFEHPSRVTKVVLDNQGRFAFTADSQKHARIWDLQTGQEISRLKYIQRQKIFSAARFSEDGTQLLTGSPDRHLTLWDVQSGAKIQDWKVHPNEKSLTKSAVVYAVAFMEDNQVISGSSSGWAEVWTVEED